MRHQKIEFRHKVLLARPHPQSYAASVLLYKQLLNQDEDFIEHKTLSQHLVDGKINKSVIRRIFFRRLIARYGSVYCRLCKRHDLVVNFRSKSGPAKNPSRKDRKQDNWATIDHIIPISDGGLKYSFKNMMCLCNSCNNKKGNKRVIKTKTGLVLNG